ncbi:MAG: PAS domain S-box-containing protein [Planctomycetota bacterium]
MNDHASLQHLAEQLRESEERYRHFIELTADSIWCLEPPEPIPSGAHPSECARILMEDARFTEANESFLRLHGIEAALGRHPTELPGFWMNGEPTRVMTLAQRRFQNQETLRKEVDDQGRVRHVSCTLYSIEDDVGLRAVWAIERDVTTLVEKEQHLRQSQEFYRAISESALDGICVLDEHLCVIDCNSAFTELAGESPSDLIDSCEVGLQPVTGIKDDPVTFPTIANLGRWRGEAILSRRPVTDTAIQTSDQAKDKAAGAVPIGLDTHREPSTSLPSLNVRVELSCRVTGAGTTRRYYCFLRDLSERQSAEKRESDHQRALAHVARLSTLGEMTSGIAHELNQPLAAIMNYANGCARILSAQGVEDPLVTKGLSAIAEQGRRAADIIRRMRSFSRRENDKREPFLVSDVLSEAIALSISEIHKAGITIDTDFAPTDDVVVVDGIQIEQVMLNLIRNAIEALTAFKTASPDDTNRISTGSGSDSVMPGPRRVSSSPPRIVIRTRLSSQSDALATDPRDASAFKLVTVSIEDNGPGISDAASARLFDPFFSRGGQGIGLGLTIGRSIVESHGGRLWYAPETEGASFHFTLPLRTAPIHE